jgi:type VI protein secretion system component VasK
MRLNDVVGMMFNGAVERLRRDAIVYGLCAICAVAVVILASSASLLVLEPHVGAVYARLIVGGVFVLIAVIAVVWMKLAQQPARRPAPPIGVAQAQAAPRNQQFAQIAMIVEAVMLGYSLSKKSDRR